MSKEMYSLCQGLFKEAQGYRVSISKLSRLKRRIESGKADLCGVIPLLLQEIEVCVRRNIRGEEEIKAILVSLNIRRNQFLELKREVTYRKGK